MSAEQTPDIAAVLAKIVRDRCPHAASRLIALDIIAALPGLGFVDAPVLAAAVREARAAELREAADQLGTGPTMRWLYERESCDWWGDRPVRDWLRDRADRITEPASHEAATSGKEASKA